MKGAAFQRFWEKYVWQTRNLSLSDPRIVDLFGGNSTASGEKVTENKGLGITAVYVCINILMQTIGTIPFSVKQKTDQGRVTLSDSSIHYLIHDQPNQNMTSYDFWSSMVMWLMAWGNAFALVERGFRNEPISLRIVWPWDMQIRENQGDYFYYYKGELMESYNVFHLRIFAKDGIIGKSPIMQNKEAMGQSIKESKYAGMAYGSKPPGFLTYDGFNLKGKQEEAYAKQWRAGTTGDNLGKTPVLKGGFKYHPVLIPPGDAEYISSRNMTDHKIYGIYRIPPTLAQNYDRATFSNAEQQDLVFIKYTALPIVTMIEKECNVKLFPSSNRLRKDKLYVKGNIKSFLQGDMVAQKELFQAMVHSAVFSPNQVLQLMDMNTYEGGDRRYIQAGSIPIDKVDEWIENKKKRPKKDFEDELREFLLSYKPKGNGQAV